jgi:AbiTii
MSTLLDDIIRLAQDDTQSLPNLLRKCLILASELKNDRVKAWANQELDGYKGPRDEQVPAYRRVRANAFGSFAGPFNAWANKHIIIPAGMEDKHKRWAREFHIVQSVSSLDDLAKTDTKQGVLVCKWPPDMVAYYSEKLWRGWICHDAWQEIPKSTLVEVLNSVRNITLRMALEMKDELGTSYGDLSRIKPEEIERVKSVVVNNLGGNVSLGDLDASGSTTIIAGDRKMLDAALAKAGMNREDLNELSEAILVDGGSKTGNKVTEWIQSKAGKVVVGGMRVTASVGQQLLTEWLMQHFGLK